MKEITKDTMICDILEMNPHMEEVLLSHGMNCVGCPGGSMETLEDAADAHGVKLKELIEELNK